MTVKCLFIYGFLLVYQVSVPNVWFSGSVFVGGWGWCVPSLLMGRMGFAYGSIFREDGQSFLASLNLR